MSWARFEQALALVWVEADEAQLPVGEWPHDVERYRFQLISPRDLEPLSAPLEITKSDGLMIPKILAPQGQLMVYASIADPASSDTLGLVTVLSAPVAVQCLPKERP